MEILGIDIGGSGVKGALVDVQTGQLVGERRRLDTPVSLTTTDVLATVNTLVALFEGYEGPLGVGFPAVVVDGSPRTPFTAHHVPGWVGYPVAETIRQLTGRNTTLLNDADAAGIAEMRFGAGRNQPGTVIVLTFGTGVGSALFLDGRLLPNTEFGNVYLKGHRQTAEWRTSAMVREKEKLSWPEYAGRVNEYLLHLEHLFTPQLFIIGGGLSRKTDNLFPLLTLKTTIVPAGLLNEAGIIGAALAAGEKL